MGKLNISVGSNFEVLYKTAFDMLYHSLHRYALTMLRDEAGASDAVQAVFVKWWETKTNVANTDEAKAYLFTAVYRQCLNVIRNEKTHKTHAGLYKQEMAVSTNEASDVLVADQLDQQIKSSIDQLPPQCRIIFMKSRFENKRYNEIAAEMDLSVKTVEVQMSKALKILRERLKEYV